MYSLFGYREMAADRVRMEAYARALGRAIRPGCTVLDIGAGTGVMSVLACRLGAGRVIAVEPDRSIRVAREVARENGCGDRIEFFEGPSTELRLEAPADVVVSDLRGVLPPHGRHIPSVVDARERLLAPGGRLIPLRDTVRGALVECAAVYERYAPLALPEHGVTLEAASRPTAHLWTRATLEPGALLSPPDTWTTVDYRTVQSPAFRGTLHWSAERAGTAHGFCLWFDAELHEGIGFSGAPGGPGLIYGQAFFPFPEPVPVLPGTAAEVELRADLVGDAYVWSWRSRIGTADYHQTSLRGALLSPAELRRGAPDAMPALSPHGEVEREILLRMDGTASVRDIAHTLAAHFPARFPSADDALEQVAALARRLAR